MVLKCLYEPITASQRHYMTKLRNTHFIRKLQGGIKCLEQYSMIFKTINSNTFVLIPGNYDLLPSIKANVDISDDPLETVCMNMTEETKKSFYKLYNTYCKLDNNEIF